MTITAANVYSGPINKLEIKVGTGVLTDLGTVGDGANIEGTFEPNKTDLGDGNQLTKFGTYKVKATILETDATTLALVQSAEVTESKLTATTLDAKTYTFGPMLLQHSIKRGFGKDPHLLVIEGQKYAVNSDDLETIT